MPRSEKASGKRQGRVLIEIAGRQVGRNGGERGPGGHLVPQGQQIENTRLKGR